MYKLCYFEGLIIGGIVNFNFWKRLKNEKLKKKNFCFEKMGIVLEYIYIVCYKIEKWVFIKKNKLRIGYGIDII